MLNDVRDRVFHVVRWVALAIPVGLASGSLSAAFLESLRWATDTRSAHDWIVWTLPAGGLLVGLAYHYLGRGLERGSNLIIEQIHTHSEAIPFRLTPLIFGASVLTHLVGGSAGREGAALQLAAGATDPFARILRLSSSDRSLMLVAAVAGGFGSVFGVPVAGAVFALEVQRVGRMRYEALVPAFVASFVGNATVGWWGVKHTSYPRLHEVAWNLSTGWRVALFGLLAGLIALTFTRTVHVVKELVRRYISWYPARPLVGGALLCALVLTCGWRDYQGVSIPLAMEAFHGSAAGQWLTKLVLSSLTIGTGFVGGEVIPLFVIGALAGASFASMLGANVALFATLGSVAVLAGAANTPLACAILGLELFGGQGIIVFSLVCVAAYATSGHTGIYHAQTVAAPKSGSSD